MKKYYLLFLFICASFALLAQENPTIKKRSFFIEAEGLKQAKKDLKKAEMYYKNRGTYDEALLPYLRLHRYNNQNSALNYKLGICYLWTSDKKQSLNYLLQCQPTVTKDYYLALGRAYQYNFKYAEAKEAYENYRATLIPWWNRQETKQVSQLLAECDFSIQQMQKDSLPVFIKNLGPIINSYYDDYGAILPKGSQEIYFTSKRPVDEPRTRVSRFAFDERLLMASNCIYEPCQWVTEDNKLTSKSNMGLAGFANHEKRIYMYRGKKGDGRIYSAVFNEKNQKWKKIKALKGKINHLAYKETQVSFSDNGTCYFTTNRRGGMGGVDIWVAEANRSGKRYKKPQPLSNAVNTPFHEATVYVTPDESTLYFSSNGHLGMGGYDLYKSTRDANGEWGEAENMGHPINSPADELFYYPTEDENIALYSTIREDSYGGLDIYKIEKDPSIPFKLMGKVADKETNAYLQASIAVYNKDEELAYSAAVDSATGIYLIHFNDTASYRVEAQYEGYRSESKTLKCPKERHASTILDFSLEQLKHPFNLIGKVADIDSNYPVQADLMFYLAGTDSLLGRTQSVDSTGLYSITFEDKFDLDIVQTAQDYFSDTTFFEVGEGEEKTRVKDFSLKRSKIDYILSGRVSELDADKAVYAALSFYNPGEEDPMNIVLTDSVSGKYSVTLPSPGPYLMEVDANRYFFVNEIYQFEEGQELATKNFELKPIKEGAKFVVQNLLFNTGKSTMKPESFKELDKVAVLLIKNEDIRIEVSGHTDNVGSASYNKKLSKNRALIVKNYLVSRGVEEDRIEYEGYGLEQPLVPNDTPEGRATNRRVQVKILN